MKTMTVGAVATGVGVLGEVIVPTIASYTPYVGATVVHGVVTPVATKAMAVAAAKVTAIGVGSGGVVGAAMLVSHVLVVGGIGCFMYGFIKGIRSSMKGEK